MEPRPRIQINSWLHLVGDQYSVTMSPPLLHCCMKFTSEPSQLVVKLNKVNEDVSLKAHLHRRFLSRRLDTIFVALKLHQVSNMFETPAISRTQIALKIAAGLHVRF